MPKGKGYGKGMSSKPMMGKDPDMEMDKKMTGKKMPMKKGGMTKKGK